MEIDTSNHSKPIYKHLFYNRLNVTLYYKRNKFHSKNCILINRICCSFYFCISFSLGLAAQPSPESFQRLNLSQFGVTEMDVNDIIQDRNGFIWMATRSGLIRNDGHELTFFRENPNDPNSISSSDIEVLTEDPAGNLWIGSSYEGLDKYDPIKNEFTHFYHDPLDSNGLSNNEIKALLIDRQGHLWIGSRAGLDILDIEDGSFIGHFRKDENAHGLSSLDINCLLEDRAGRIWIGTFGGGLYCLDNNSGLMTQFSTSSDENSRIPHNEILTLSLGREGKIWFSTGNKMLFSVDPTSLALNPFDPYQGIAGLQDSSSIWTILPNDDGTLWLGTHANGLIHFSPDLGNKLLYQSSASSSSIAGNIITSLWLDMDGDLWIGHKGPGISRLPLKGKGFDIVPVPYPNPNAPRYPAYKCITEDDDGNLWLGTWRNGLLFYNRESRKSSLFQVGAGDGLVHDLIWDILKDNKGYIWIATHDGLQRIDPKTEKFRTFKEESGLNYTSVRSLWQDTHNRLWIGTFRGLYWLDPTSEKIHFADQIPNDSSLAVVELFGDSKGYLWISLLNQGVYRMNLATGQYDHYRKRRNDPKGLTSNTIWSIVEDKKGRTWLGTAGGGLNLFVEPGVEGDAGTFKHWRMYNSNLPDENILNLSVDTTDCLWLTTDVGILSFNPSTEVFKSYELPGSIKGLNVETRPSKDGHLYIGNTEFVFRFSPDSVWHNTRAPKTFITRLLVNGKEVPIKRDDEDDQGTKGFLRYSVLFSSSIELNYRENNLTFDFAALNYIQSENNRYRFQLENYDPVITEVDANNRSIRYTNLSPGKYTFTIQGSNNHGIFGDPTSLMVTILPPWYATRWAYSLYLFLLAATYYSIFQFFANRKRQKREAKRLLELNQVKSRLYTYITHEFRTPLTLILGGVDQLRTILKEPTTTILDRIDRSGGELLRLVNQMLGLTKAEAGQLSLNPIQSDIVFFLRYLTDSFNSLAVSKNIQLSFNANLKEFSMDFDPEYLQQAVSNLLSNALKFTPSGGRVEIAVQVNNSQLLIEVIDNGRGISPQDLPHIFDKFFRATQFIENNRTLAGEGTGIGLALTQELIQLMNGSISVESELEIGSTFRIYIPVTNRAQQGTVLPQASTKYVLPPISATTNIETTITENLDLPLVVIVEDNADVRAYLKSCLTNEFRVVETIDGIDGRNKVVDLIPDLVISDVMMPGLDGFELCSELKNDSRTSHIPVILLTAKADLDARLEGLGKGADAYLAKPFVKAELLIRAKRLVELRKRLQFFYQSLLNPTLVEAVNTPEPTESAFIKEARKIVIKNLDNTQFAVPDLARGLARGKSQLNRKMQNLIGMSPVEFIRNIRLGVACNLLRDQQLTIAEVAYKCGFSDPRYFSRIFKQAYGLTPSDYRRQN